MPSSFGQYTSGIQPVQGIAEAGANIGKSYERGMAQFGQSLSEGIQGYMKGKAENEMIDQEASMLGSQLQQFHSIFGSNPEYAPFAEQLNGYVDKLSKIPEMSLAQKRGALNGAKVAFSQIGTQLQMFNMMKDENTKRNIAAGIANTPDKIKSVEALSVDAGRFGINSNEPLAVQRGKFVEKLMANSIWDDKSKSWTVNGTDKKIDLSLALKNWDAGAKQSLEELKNKGNTAAPVMLEQLDAMAQMRSGEQYRANLSEGQTTDESQYDSGRGLQGIYTPSAEALMQMRGVGSDVSQVDTSLNSNVEVNKLKEVALTERNKQLEADIANYDKQIKASTDTSTRFSDIQINPMAVTAESAFPGIGALIPVYNALSGKNVSPVTVKNKAAVAESRVKSIEALQSRRDAAVTDIEKNKKKLEQISGNPNVAVTDTGTAKKKPLIDAGIGSFDVGTELVVQKMSDEQRKETVRNWMAQNHGIEQTIKNADGTISTIKVAPSNFDELYRKLVPTPQIYRTEDGVALLQNADGSYKQLELPRTGMTPSERATMEKGMIGDFPMFKNQQVDPRTGLVPVELGYQGSGISISGKYRHENSSEFLANANRLVEAKRDLAELMDISKNSWESLSVKQRQRAWSLATIIQANMKTPIVGNQVTEKEWEILRKLVPSTADTFSWEGGEREAIKVLQEKANRAIYQLGQGTGLQLVDKSGQNTASTISDIKSTNAANRSQR